MSLLRGACQHRGAVEIPDEAVAAGTVITWSVPDQTALKAGDSVVKGTTVAVNISTGPAMRDVPDLTKMTLADATKKLTDMGLLIVEGEKKPHPEIPADQIAASVAGWARLSLIRPGQILVHTAAEFGVEVLGPAAVSGAIPIAIHPAMQLDAQISQQDLWTIGQSFNLVIKCYGSKIQAWVDDKLAFVRARIEADARVRGGS